MELPNRNSRLVFVSHSGVDTWVAKQVAREIAACGATPFLDEAEVDAGADFEEDIRAVGSTHEAAARMRSMEKLRVFISHSSRDTDWARSFARALKERGVAVWFDEFDVRPGESVRDALEAGFRGSDVLVVLLDAKSPSSPYLFFELGAAIGTGKRVVAIVPKDLDPTVLPLDVRLRRYLIRETPEQTAEELSSSLQAA